MRQCTSACALDHQWMDVSAAIYVAVTSRECMKRPKTPLVDYHKGVSYTSPCEYRIHRCWLYSKESGSRCKCIDAADNICLRLWPVCVRRPPLSVPVLEEWGTVGDACDDAWHQEIRRALQVLAFFLWAVDTMYPYRCAILFLSMIG